MEFVKNDEEFSKKIITFLQQKKVKNPLIISGKSSFAASQAKNVIDKIFQYKYINFSDYLPNPSLNEIEKGIEIFKSKKCDGVLAIGGGTALDIGKSISLLSQQSKIPSSYLTKENKITKDRVPLLLIPTTAGTGSEATQFAVIYMNKTKFSLDHAYLLPDSVILYPALTYSLTKELTAITGVDALSQSIEALWNINSNEESDKYSKKAIRIIIEHLSRAYDGKLDSREKMLEASYLSGKAINITRTTAPHALSYYLTSKYEITHGQAVAVTLPSFLRYNSEISIEECIDLENYKQIREKIFFLCEILKAKDIKDAQKKLESFFKKLGIKTSLKDLKIPHEAIEDIINNVNLDRLKNNPRKLDKIQLRVIIEALLR